MQGTHAYAANPSLAAYFRNLTKNLLSRLIHPCAIRNMIVKHLVISQVRSAAFKKESDS